MMGSTTPMMLKPATAFIVVCLFLAFSALFQNTVTTTAKADIVHNTFGNWTIDTTIYQDIFEFKTNNKNNILLHFFDTRNNILDSYNKNHSMTLVFDEDTKLSNITKVTASIDKKTVTCTYRYYNNIISIDFCIQKLYNYKSITFNIFFNNKPSHYKFSLNGLADACRAARTMHAPAGNTNPPTAGSTNHPPAGHANAGRQSLLGYYFSQYWFFLIPLLFWLFSHKGKDTENGREAVSGQPTQPDEKVYKVRNGDTIHCPACGNTIRTKDIPFHQYVNDTAHCPFCNAALSIISSPGKGKRKKKDNTTQEGKTAPRRKESGKGEKPGTGPKNAPACPYCNRTFDNVPFYFKLYDVYACPHCKTMFRKDNGIMVPVRFGGKGRPPINLTKPTDRKTGKMPINLMKKSDRI